MHQTMRFDKCTGNNFQPGQSYGRSSGSDSILRPIGGKTDKKAGPNKIEPAIVTNCKTLVCYRELSARYDFFFSRNDRIGVCAISKFC